MPKNSKTATSRSRELRRDSTYPEQLLWSRLRAGRLAGLKFRRQHPVGRFIADFFRHDAALIIELDGDSHNGRATYDCVRTSYLECNGCQVVRFGNDEVIRDLDAVLNAILLACGVDPNAPSPARSSLPSPKGRRKSRIPSPKI